MSPSLSAGGFRLDSLECPWHRERLLKECKKRMD